MILSSQKIPSELYFWLICVNFLSLLPHINNLPSWLNIFCLFCILWRLLILKKDWPLPRSITKVVLIIFVTVGIIFEYIETAGPDMGVALLAVGFALKILELKWLRDAYVISILAIFITCMSFLYSMTLVSGLYALFIFMITLASFMKMNRTDSSGSIWNNIKQACVILFQSIPLMIILFIFFPRVDPIWANRADKDTDTGLSESMSPTDIANMANKNKLAFRVEFQDQVPPQESLYWRAVVFSIFNGHEWRINTSQNYFDINADKKPSWFNNIKFMGNPIKYRVILEPTQQQFAFSLDIAKPTIQDMLYTKDLRFMFPVKVFQAKEYEMTSYLKYQAEPFLDEVGKEEALQLPVEGNEKSKALALSWYKEESNDPEKYINRVLSWFKKDQFFYTLKPPKLENQIVDQFLFDSKKGFCAHFASAFVFLMRAAGVPARVVAGYHGGEVNPFSGYILVHQFDAHAWAEVWIKNKGWIRIDPTAHVAPQRILDSVEQALSQAGFLRDQLSSTMKFRHLPLVKWARQWGDYMELTWNKSIVSFNKEKQQELLSKFWAEFTARLFLWLTVICFLLGALFFLWSLFSRPPTHLNELEQAYLHFCFILKEYGFEREKGETPYAFYKRIKQARPEWDEKIQMITQIFTDCNYMSTNHLNKRSGKLQAKKAVKAIYRLTKALH